MKYNSMIMALLCSTMAATAQYPYSLTCHIDNPALKGKKLILKVYNGVSIFFDSDATQDTAFIKGDSVKFNGTLKRPNETCSLFLYDGAKYITVKGFVLEAGHHSLRIKRLTKNSPYKKNPLSNIDFGPSIPNELDKKLEKTELQYYSRQSEEGWATQMALAKLTAIDNHPASYYSVTALYYIFEKHRFGLSPGRVDSSFRRLPDSIQQSPLGRQLAQQIQHKKDILIGQPAPGFTINDAQGQPFSSSSLAGRPWVLAFGATWCGPCIANIPHLKKLYQQYKKEGLEIVYVNLDTAAVKWRRMIQEKGMNWVNVSALRPWRETTIASQYCISAIPVYFVINRKGIIIYNPMQLKDPEKDMLEQYIKAAVKTN